MRGWLALLVIVWLVPWSAQAFPNGYEFGVPVSSAGGGGVYFTGSPRFKRYDCRACHIDSAGVIDLDLSSDPPGLIEDGEFEPGQRYQIGVELVGEHRGLEAAKNTNVFGFEAIDPFEEPAGLITDFDGLELKLENVGDLLFSRPGPGVAWTFEWQAPPEGTPFVDLYFVLVDGDGAAIPEEPGANDPFHDDVATRALRIARAGLPVPPLDPPLVQDRDVSACSVGASGGSIAWIGLVLLAFVGTRCRRSAVLLLVLVAGCTSVKPHERRDLARDLMDLDGEAREAALEQHYLQYREGSVGVGAGGGSGCGCN